MYKKESIFDKAMNRDQKEWLVGFKNLDKEQNVYVRMQKQMADENQDVFDTEYIGKYQSDFTGMTTGITGVWGTAQGLMTAAGVSGETQRLASMASYGMQGIGLIQKLAKSHILTDAYRAAAAAYAWMVELLPPPAGEIAGAAAAAITFAAISAYGVLGGDTSGIASSAGGDYQVGGTGPRFVHKDETILPVWAAESWRDIVSRGDTGNRPGENGGGLHIGAIHIDARGADKDIDWRHVVNREIIPVLDEALKRRGLQKIGGGR
jgi:hypothetical protein